MLFDAIAVGLLGIFMLVGALRGTLAGMLRVGTLVAAYTASWLAATRLGPGLALLIDRSQLMAGALLGTIVFLVTFVIASLIARRVVKRAQAKRDGAPRAGFDRIGGALFGSAQAALSLLLLGLFGSFLDAAYRAGLPNGSDAAQGSYLVGVTQKLVAVGARGALGDGPGAQLAVELATDPATAIGSVQSLLENQNVSRLQQDVLFWQYMSTGEVERATSRSAYFAVVHDEALRTQLADMSLVTPVARGDSDQFNAELTALLKHAAPRIQALRNDPAIAQLAAKPSVQRAIASGNSFALVTDSDFRALVDRVLKGLEQPPQI